MKSFRTIIFWSLLFIGNTIQAQITDSTEVDSIDAVEDEKVIPLVKEDSVQTIDWKAVKEKLVYGGNLGLGFYTLPTGQSFTVFELSPQIGYKVKENRIVGAGLQLLGVTGKHNSYFQYGPDIFVRQHIINILFAQAQFEYINFEEDYLLPGKRRWNPALLLGFGYGTYGYSFGLYTDVVQTKYSEQIYPGNIYIGPKPQTGRYPYGVPFFFRGEILF